MLPKFWMEARFLTITLRPRHPHGASRQGHRRDHGEKLRREAYGERHRKEYRLEWVLCMTAERDEETRA